MVPIVLIALWVVVLTPMALQHYRNQRPGHSIATFHRQLNVLGRSSPQVLHGGYLEESNVYVPQIAVGQTNFPTSPTFTSRPNLVLVRPVSEGEKATLNPKDEIVDDKSGEHYRRIGYIAPPKSVETTKVVELPPSRYQPRPLPQRNVRSREEKMEAEERRRDILFGLILLFVVSGLCGLDAALRGLLALTVISGLLLVGFFALTVYAKSLEPVGAQHTSRHLRHEERLVTDRIVSPQPAKPLAKLPETGDFAMPGYWDDEFDPARSSRAL